MQEQSLLISPAVEYHLLTQCPKVIILVPKGLSLRELFNGMLSFALSSILADIRITVNVIKP